jgi:hypothetical protein
MSQFQLKCRPLPLCTLQPTFNNFYNAPVFFFANRPRLNEFHTIPDLAPILLIVRLELCHTPHHLSVNWMGCKPLNCNDDRFGHLITYNPTYPFSMPK